MHVFLQFLFNADSLREDVRQEWMNLYDYTYIDEKIIGTIEKNLPNVSDILKTVEKRATGKTVSTLSQSDQEQTKFGETGGLSQSLNEDIKIKKATEPKPFNLTKPKPKVIPQPEALPRELKSNPIPKNLFKKNLADLEKEKQERRKEKLEKVKQSYDKDDKKRF